MKRKLFPFLSALSLMLCAVAAVMWVRSHWRTDQFAYVRGTMQTGGLRCSIDSAEGGLCLCVERCTGPSKSALQPGLHRTSVNYSWNAGIGYPIGRGPGKLFGAGSMPERWGFEVQNLPLPAGKQHNVTIPYWFVVLVLALPLVIELRNQCRLARLNRRKRLNLCLQCGYDLRASQERCPECGRPFDPPSQSIPSAPPKSRRRLKIVLALAVPVLAIVSYFLSWASFEWSPQMRVVKSFASYKDGVVIRSRLPTAFEVFGIPLLPRVTGLSFWNRSLDDQALASLAKLSDVESLTLQYVDVSDSDLVYIQGLPNLKILGLLESQVTDEGLKHLAGMKQLKDLWIGSSMITDKGIEHLRDVPNLRRLTLICPGVTDQGIERLRQAAPGLEIDRQ